MLKLVSAHRVRLVALLLVGCAGGAARAEEPAAPVVESAARYADVSARIARHDAPLWLQLRLEADGLLSLRSALDAAEPAWVARGAWRFTGVPAEDMTVLRGLHAALRAALGGDTPDPALREPDQHSRARVLIDAAPEVAWLQVLWVLGAGYADTLRLWQITFLAPEAGTWFDFEIPKDRTGGYSRQRQHVRFLEVVLFRKNVDDLAAPDFTRLRLTSEVREVRGTWPNVIEDESAEEIPSAPSSPATPGAPSEAPAKPEPVAEKITVDLASAVAPSGAHAGAWRRVSAFLDRGGESPPHRLGEIRTPPPTGGLVPASDVIEVMLRLRDAGCAKVSIEGAAAPLDHKHGGGWGSFR